MTIFLIAWLGGSVLLTLLLYVFSLAARYRSTHDGSVTPSEITDAGPASQ